MSFRTWSENGFGIDVSNLTPDFEKLIKYIHSYADNNTKTYVSTLINADDNNKPEHYNNKNKLDAFDEYEGELSEYGVFALIADIIRNKEGIWIAYYQSSDGFLSVIMFPDSQPFSMNKKEKSLTKEKLIDIIKTNLEEVGIITQDDDYTFHNVEYFG